jgi:hypothetical protein
MSTQAVLHQEAEEGISIIAMSCIARHAVENSATFAMSVLYFIRSLERLIIVFKIPDQVSSRYNKSIT